jgi:hypothetical protein
MANIDTYYIQSHKNCSIFEILNFLFDHIINSHGSEVAQLVPKHQIKDFFLFFQIGITMHVAFISKWFFGDEF